MAQLAIVGRELPEEVLDLIRSFSTSTPESIYKEAMRVLRLHQWTTLYEQLHGDRTDYLIPLLLKYQEAVTNRMQTDQQLLHHYRQVPCQSEGDRLSHLYAQHHQTELRLFEALTEELYGEQKKQWELHDLE